MTHFFAGTDPSVSPRETRNQSRVRRAAAEGMVLLENRGGLPMALRGRRVALFGNGARHTVQGGTGSGEVNNRGFVTVEQGLRNAGAEIVTERFLDGDCPIGEAFPDADAALYILARNSGEGADRKNEPGDFRLSDEERALIEAVGRRYGGVTVVLNVGGVLDASFLQTCPCVNAVLLMSQPGSASGDALADVLSGVSEPCGRLTTTWGRYGDYPNAAKFSHNNGDTDDEFYTEGVFVGYRWFDSFGKTPLYPFGYGLSYTSFAMETENVSFEGENVAVCVRVRNTGSRPGKQVAQVYVSAPEGRLCKPYQELRAFGKTGRLQPGESETLTLTFPIARMASFDEARSRWVLEAGEYLVRVGEHSRRTKLAAVLTLEREAVCEQLAPIMPLDCEMEVLQPDRSLYYTYPEERSERETAVRLSLDGFAPSEAPARCAPKPDTSLADRLTSEEQASLCVGAPVRLVPGAAGETAALPERGVPGLALADGPAGLRLCPSFAADESGEVVFQAPAFGVEDPELLGKDRESKPGETVYYQYATAIPIATALAQTWNTELLREMGDLVGEEMDEFGVTLWLAPGMNIHRNPLCGRNFEYFSEDPLIAGLCAAHITKGVQSHPGRGTTIKHFCCNNQEDNRLFVNEHVFPRALREIYLRGFEIAVKESQPLAIMTSYNLVNGVHTANARDLLTVAARDEWGFRGVVMTDWGTTHPDSGHKYGNSSAAGCIRAGNDLVMPGEKRDKEEILEALEAGTLSKEALRDCAARVLALSGPEK